MPDRNPCDTIARWLAGARSAVAFTGAGVSTESGIPDFRSPGGVWATSQPVYFDDFLRSAEARFEYWRQKSQAHRDFFEAQPNVAHRALARWQSIGRLHALITQNIDGLHQLAGNRNVLELHGTARQVGCLDCLERFDADPLVQQFLQTQQAPSCPACGSGLMKHATVSFGQALPRQVLADAMDWARRADVFLAIGSSLVVEPAASLPALAKQNGAKLIIINRDSTPLDHYADLIVRDGIGATFEQIEERLNALQSEI